MTPALEYVVEAASLQAHLFRVTLSVSDPRPEGETLRLPAWIPGSYMIREFARNIVEIAAQQGGRGVALNKLDKHTWRTGRLDECVPLEVVATVYAWDLSVRCAHLDETHGFFNGTQLFLAVAGSEDLPHRVDIRRPPGHAFVDWRVATTLPASVRGISGVDHDGFGWREAANYDELVDHPVEMGAFQLLSFDALGVRHDMAITGRVLFDAERLQADLQKICAKIIRLFGEETPFRRYLFQAMVVGEGYGGLEHRDSSALLCSRADLPPPGVKHMDERYRTFLGLCSHEYFHAWNVKRIKPAAFMPYRLDEENYTRLLWVFEGFTSYYDDLTLVRSGLITAAEYLGMLAKTATAVGRGSGRLKQSVADSSHDAWIKYYRQDENSPNAVVSYYQKGALIALGLDLTIRARTGGERSLDDVMRHLWRHYGRAAVGVPEDAMPAIIKAATGVNVGREIARWAEGTEDVPLERLFKTFGVSMRRKKGALAGGLGVRTRGEGLALRLASVMDDGSGVAAGLSAGDELVAIDGLRVTATNLESLLLRYAAGDELGVTAFRRDELMQFKVEFRGPQDDELEFGVAARQSPLARGLREQWLGRHRSPAARARTES